MSSTDSATFPLAPRLIECSQQYVGVTFYDPGITYPHQHFPPSCKASGTSEAFTSCMRTAKRFSAQPETMVDGKYARAVAKQHECDRE